jgi:Cys-rich protein (TIGR01571 family)
MGKRKTLRDRYRIQDDCNNCLVTTCCSECAICQEARELKFRSSLSGGMCLYKNFKYY